MITTILPLLLFSALTSAMLLVPSSTKLTHPTLHRLSRRCDPYTICYDTLNPGAVAGIISAILLVLFLVLGCFVGARRSSASRSSRAYAMPAHTTYRPSDESGGDGGRYKVVALPPYQRTAMFGSVVVVPGAAPPPAYSVADGAGVNQGVGAPVGNDEGATAAVNGNTAGVSAGTSGGGGGS